MGDSFYDPGEQRAAKVNELFTRIAPRYDLINDLQSFGLHRYWKRRVIELARPAPGLQALDLCCGTADLALRLARRGARVVGLDFNARMLDVAVQRTSARHNSERVSLVAADATRIPFPTDTFDLVTIGYGLRNLPSWEAGLHEMQRVAKPGGRLLVLEFGKPRAALWKNLYFAYLRCFVPVLGSVMCGNARAYSYILESLEHYPSQEGVAAAMQAMLLQNVRVINLLGGAMSINYAEKPPS
jgi:demethylmenaquinone methyltransferase/2-methoxy-6-polyprenyl-1,4-benzoquinol methylase